MKGYGSEQQDPQQWNVPRGAGAAEMALYILETAPGTCIKLGDSSHAARSVIDQDKTTMPFVIGSIR